MSATTAPQSPKSTFDPKNGLLFGVDAMLMAVVAMSALLIYRHRTNIDNLLRGKETRIGKKSGVATK